MCHVYITKDLPPDHLSTCNLDLSLRTQHPPTGHIQRPDFGRDLLDKIATRGCSLENSRTWFLTVMLIACQMRLVVKQTPTLSHPRIDTLHLVYKDISRSPQQQVT